MEEDIITQIDAAIKSIWLHEIQKDYSERYLLKEDSLKSAFYYHLRSALRCLLKKNDLRIFTEFADAGMNRMGYRADLAVVKVPKYFTGHMGETIKEKDIFAIIEFKYTNARQAGINAGYYDVEKLKQFIQLNKFPNCQYYLGGIYESSFDLSQLWYLDKRQAKHWADGRFTELVACYINDSDGLGFTFQSYNHLNKQLNGGIDNVIYYATLGV